MIKNDWLHSINCFSLKTIIGKEIKKIGVKVTNKTILLEMSLLMTMTMASSSIYEYTIVGHKFVPKMVDVFHRPKYISKSKNPKFNYT